MLLKIVIFNTLFIQVLILFLYFMKENNKYSSKIWTIVTHEYFSKVKSKGFIIGTFLGPLFFIILIGIVVIINIISVDDTSKKLAIVDKNDLVASELIKLDTAKYFKIDKSQTELNNLVIKGKIDGYVIINDDIINKSEATIYSKGGGGSGLVTSLENNLEEIIRKQRLLNSGITQDIITFIDRPTIVNTQKVTEKGIEKDYTEAFAFIGYLLGFAIYILIFIYGSFVSRAVIEEKANRIVEIIISSVKPFDLMFGKVLGIAFVALTQITTWIVLFVAFSTIAGIVATNIIGDNFTENLKDKKSTQQLQSNIQKMNMTKELTPKKDLEESEAQQVKIAKMLQNIPTISPMLLVGFVFYFLAGYFIYSTLFAAVGSAVDQESDAGQLQLPVSMPVIIPILVIPQVMSNPDSTFSTIMSLIPFFTPILMTVRIAATTVPIWQILLSVVLCVLTFLGALWVSAKIYRIGILMTGKKPSFKDLYKWIKIN